MTRKNLLIGIIGVLIGTVIGGGIGLLFAPEKGKRLRKDIDKEVKGTLDKADRWKEIAYEKGSDLAQKAKDTTSEVTQTIKDKTKNS